eukprot:473752_1
MQNGFLNGGCTDWAYFTGTAVTSKIWYKTPTSLGTTNTAYYTDNSNLVLKRHFTDVARYIVQVDADIVIVQEVCDCDSLEYLNAKINTQNGGDFHYKPWIPNNQGNQMKVGYLTRLDPTASAAYNIGEKGFEAQFSLWGTTIYLYGVHFTAGGGNGGTRSRDNDAIALETVYRGHLPNVIVAGDFNGGIAENNDRQIEFDINTDELILDNLNYGSWNGEARRCENTNANFWWSGGTGYKGLLTTELRRNTDISPPGIGWGVGV